MALAAGWRRSSLLSRTREPTSLLPMPPPTAPTMDRGGDSERAKRDIVQRALPQENGADWKVHLPVAVRSAAIDELIMPTVRDDRPRSIVALIGATSVRSAIIPAAISPAKSSLPSSGRKS